MNILVTTPGKLIKNLKGDYYTNILYGCDYFNKYLTSFDHVIKPSQIIQDQKSNVKNMMLVNNKKITVVELPTTNGPLNYIIQYRKIKQVVVRAISNCDAAALRLPDPVSFIIVRYCRRRCIPFVVEITTDVWSYLAPGNNQSVIRPFLRMWWHYLQKKACMSANGVVYVTKYTLQYRYPSTYSKLPYAKGYFEDWFSDVDISKNDFAKLPKFYSNNINNVNIVHVSGSLSNIGKGYKELLEATKILVDKGHNIIINLVGGDNLSKHLQEYSIKNRLSIIMHGKIADRRSLFAVLRKCDLFVFPSYTEGLPRVVIEAMVNGLPVIASNIPGNAELLDSIALFPVKNSIALADKMESFITNKELLNEQAERNLKEAEQYSKEIIEKKEKEFYKKLADSVGKM